MNDWFTVEWWRTPLASGQGGSNNEFDRPITLLSMMLTGIAGAVFFGISPIVATAYVDFWEFSEAQAGYLLAADLSGFTIGTLLVSAKIHIWNRRMIAITGLAVLLLGNLGCLTLAEFEAALIVRFIIGIGAGSVAGVMIASIAATSTPDRFFGFYTVLALSTLAFLMFLTPRLLITFGIKGLFSLLAAMTLPAFCLVRNFPESAVAADGSVHKTTATWRDIPIRILIIVCVTTLAYYIGTGGVWTYLAQVGKARGFDIEATGNLLAMSLIVGIAGAMVPLVLAARLGRALPIGLSMCFSIICLVSLITLSGKLVYGVAIQVYTFAWFLFFPYLMGIVSELDPLGRLAGVCYSVQSIGFAIGPALAAWLITGGEYASLFYMGIVCYLITLILLLPIALKQDARRKGAL